MLPQFLDAYIKCASDHQPELPNVNDFIPEITEPYIIKESGMMEVHLDRQRLFQKKTFVFMVKRHMEKFEPIIKLAAGKCINLQEDKLPKKKFLLKSDYIPVKYTPSFNTPCSYDVAHIVQYIESNNRRLINESEIGLAIIHRATDRFCNPDRNLVSDFEPDSVNTEEIFKNILAEDTPQTTTNTETPVSILDEVVPETMQLTGSESNNNLRHNEAIDLNKPVTPTTRRSTRSSTKSSPNEVMGVQKKVPTPTKNQKRKHPCDPYQADQQENVDQALIVNEQSLSQKRQKTQDGAGSQGEANSANSIEPLPPQSQSDHNFSGFISTQNRFNRKRKATQDQLQTAEPENCTSPSKETRKRVISLLTADSDEENDNDESNIFQFSRKSKRTKTTSKETQRRVPERTIFDDDSDDGEEGGGFKFTQKPMRQSQAKQKSTQGKSSENDSVDAPVVTDTQNSYKKPFQQSFNRTIKPVEITSAPKCDAEWISLKMKKELNLNESHSASVSQPSNSVRIKEEKLEEWELTDEEKKRQWIKSMARVFEVRLVEVNTTRRSMADETDSLVSEAGNTAMNKTKNFKRFVKVI